MKILLASKFILPHSGGLWTYVSQLKRGFEEKGHDVHVLALHPDGSKYYLLDQGIFFNKKEVEPLISNHFSTNHEIVPQRDPFIMSMENERYIFELAAAYLGVTNYDVIHTQDIISTRGISRIKLKRTPLIATIHGFLTSECILQGLIKEEDSVQWHYSLAQEFYGVVSSDITIVPSNFMRNKLLHDFQIQEPQMQVIPHGMNIPAFLQEMNVATLIRRSGDKKVITCVARLDKLKGHLYLLQALSQLKQERTDWVCWIIGDGPEKSSLELLTKELKLIDHIIFLGDRKDVPSLLKMSDLCVLPSIQENYPYFVMESQIAGKPIIASDVGGIPEMIKHEETGILSPSGQSEHLYLNIKKILNDLPFQNQLAQNAEKWSKSQYSLDAMIQKTLEVYHRSLKMKRDNSE